MSFLYHYGHNFIHYHKALIKTRLGHGLTGALESLGLHNGFTHFA